MASRNKGRRGREATHIVPPKSWAFKVTTAAPNHTTKNTAAKTRAPCSSGAVMLRRIERVRQTRSGPHRSPK